MYFSDLERWVNLRYCHVYYLYLYLYLCSYSYNALTFPATTLLANIVPTNQQICQYGNTYQQYIWYNVLTNIAIVGALHFAIKDKSNYKLLSCFFCEAGTQAPIISGGVWQTILCQNGCLSRIFHPSNLLESCSLPWCFRKQASRLRSLCGVWQNNWIVWRSSLHSCWCSPDVVLLTY